MAGINSAEKIFIRLLIKNKLVDENTLNSVLERRNSWQKTNLSDQLVHENLIKGGHAKKILAVIQQKGLTLPETGEEGSGSQDDGELGFIDSDQIDTEYQAPEPMYGLGESQPTIGTISADFNYDSLGSKTNEPGEYDIEDGALTKETICEPQGDGHQLIELLQQARLKKASDLHISTGVQAFTRNYETLTRLDTPIFTPEQTESMLFDVLNQNQKDKCNEDLQLDFCLELKDGSRYRANIVKDRLGWSGCFRIINNAPPSFEELGLPSQIKNLTEFNTGIVLVTGPKGCGKTTTMAAMIDLINKNRQEHIITMEDPIEYRHPSKRCQVTQRSLGAHTLSYANALRASLRQDPDVMLIGEMRDIDTISAAITAAETGHLVFGSLHTNSAARTIDRIIAAFPPDQQAQVRVMIAESIRGVICQELIPTADGKGVALAVEILMNNVSVRKMIVDSRTFQLESVMQTSKKQGMVRMDDSIMQLIQSGKITRDVGMQYLRNPKSVM